MNLALPEPVVVDESGTASAAADRRPPRPLRPLDMHSASLVWAVRPSGSDLRRARADYRDPAARDRARLLHSAAFRRLQGQSRWPGGQASELPHSALIHATQVGQLSRALVRAAQGLYPHSVPWRAWLPDPNLAEAVAMGQLLGQTPYGQLGAQVLDTLAAEVGGYNRHAQALRVVSVLEPHTPQHGLDLTRRTLLGLFCRQAATGLPSHYPTEQALVDWLVQPLSERDRRWLLAPRSERPEGAVGSLDATIVHLAEDIAWVHDLEDAIVLGQLLVEDWLAVSVQPAWAEAVDLAPWSQLAADLFGASAPARRRSVGALINALLVSTELEEDPSLDEPLLRYRVQLMPPARDLLAHLRRLVVKAHARGPQAQLDAANGRDALLSAYCVLSDTPGRLPPHSLLARRWRACEDLGAGPRGVIDLTASLTEASVSQLAALAPQG